MPPATDNAAATALGLWILEQLKRGGAGIALAAVVGGGGTVQSCSIINDLKRQVDMANAAVKELEAAKSSALAREIDRAEAYECQLRVQASALERLGFKPPRNVPSGTPWVVLSKDEQGRETFQSLEQCKKPPDLPGR